MDGQKLGALCVIDAKFHDFGLQQKSELIGLADSIGMILAKDDLPDDASQLTHCSDHRPPPDYSPQLLAARRNAAFQVSALEARSS